MAKNICFLIFGLILVIGACAKNVNISNLDLCVKNVGSKNIDCVYVSLSEVNSNFGVLYSSKSKTNMSIESEIGSDVVVHYTYLDEDNSIEKKVKIPWIKIENIQGEIVLLLIINSDNGDIEVDFLQTQEVTKTKRREISLLTGKVYQEWESRL